MLSFTENKDEIIKYLVSKGFLVSSDFFDKVKEEFDAEIISKFKLSSESFFSFKDKKTFSERINGLGLQLSNFLHSSSASNSSFTLSKKSELTKNPFETKYFIISSLFSVKDSILQPQAFL